MDDELHEPWEPSFDDVFYSPECQEYALLFDKTIAVQLAWSEVAERFERKYNEQLEQGWQELEAERRARLWELRTMPLKDYYDTPGGTRSAERH